MMPPLTPPARLVGIDMYSRADDAVTRRRERSDAIRAAYSAGYSMAEIAAAYSLSASRVRGLVRDIERIRVPIRADSPRRLHDHARAVIVPVHESTASSCVTPRRIAVSLPCEPWESAGATRSAAPRPERVTAARPSPDRLPHGTARVAVVKRIIREVAAMPADDDEPRELVF